jgi:hypothetical protein
MTTWRAKAGWLAGLVLLLGLVAPAAAADPDQVSRAQGFLAGGGRPKAILFFMHPTAEYRDMQYLKQTGVVSGTGLERPGWFCLHYRFRWKSGLFGDENTTEFRAFFNDRGRLAEIQAGPTSSFAGPFTATNIVMAAVKDEVLKNVKGDNNKERIVRRLIEDADARGLLTFLLQVDQ